MPVSRQKREWRFADGITSRFPCRSLLTTGARNRLLIRKRSLEKNGTAEQKRSNAIREIFPQVNYWEEKNLIRTEQETQYVPLGDRIFAMHVRQTLGKTHLAAFLLTDETEHLKTVETLEKERGVAGLIYVDNFEELLKHTEADQHSLLGALVEQQIQKYFMSVGGVSLPVVPASAPAIDGKQTAKQTIRSFSSRTTPT